MLAGAWLAVAVVGTGVVVWGLRGRRVGRDPHCCRCSYNLTGLTSERCPECGVNVAVPSGVVHGERRRRPRLVTVGALAAVVGLTLLVVQATRPEFFDAYRWLPLPWLLERVASTDQATAARATGELARRVRCGACDDGQCARIAEVCLKEQRRAELRDGVSKRLIELLDAPVIMQVMSDEQRERFYRSMLDMVMHVVPTCKCESRTATELRGCASWLTMIRRAPEGQYWARLDYGPMQSTYGPCVGNEGRYHSFVGIGNSETSESHIYGLEGEGACELWQEVHVAVFRGGSEKLHTGTIVCEYDIHLSAVTVLLPPVEDPAEPGASPDDVADN